MLYDSYLRRGKWSIEMYHEWQSNRLTESNLNMRGLFDPVDFKQFKCDELRARNTFNQLIVDGPVLNCINQTPSSE